MHEVGTGVTGHGDSKKRLGELEKWKNRLAPSVTCLELPPFTTWSFRTVGRERLSEEQEGKIDSLFPKFTLFS
jgi:hypothetical protein